MLAKSILPGLGSKASRFIRAVRRAVVTATILIAAVAAHGATIVEQHGALSVKGNRIVDKNGIALMVAVRGSGAADLSASGRFKER